MNKKLTCQKCDICINNNFIPILGRGNIKAGIFFIGEAPGYSEVKYNLPFVGKSGKKLQLYINSYKLTDNVFITNAVKCRPTGNRTPFDDEINNCNKYLNAEITIGNPKIIVLLGLTAVRSYFGINITKLGKLVNRPIKHKGRIIIPTYHPSYILRSREQEIHYLKLFEIVSKLKISLNI